MTYLVFAVEDFPVNSKGNLYFIFWGYCSANLARLRNPDMHLKQHVSVIWLANHWILFITCMHSIVGRLWKCHQKLKNSCNYDGSNSREIVGKVFEWHQYHIIIMNELGFLCSTLFIFVITVTFGEFSYHSNTVSRSRLMSIVCDNSWTLYNYW